MDVPAHRLVVKLALFVEFPAVDLVAKLLGLVHGKLVRKHVVALGVVLVPLD